VTCGSAERRRVGLGDNGAVRLPRVLLAAGMGCVALAGCGAKAMTPAPVPASYHGVEPTDRVGRPSYVLRDTSHRQYDFGAQTRGHPTYVYFGYTHCPDECPTAMADLAAVLRRSPPPLRAQVRVVFVTTDPARDTAPVLRRWLDQFSPDFVGLRGTPAQVSAAQRASGVPVARPGPPIPTIPGHPDRHSTETGTAPHKHVGPLGYSVNHSSVIFAYDAADRLPVVYPGGATPADIAADLPVLARRTS